MKKIKVIVVDDHPFIIEGIKISLMGVDDIEIIGEASDEEELLSILTDPYPDVLLLDIILPGTSGIELARIITEKYPSIKVIMVSANMDEAAIVSSLGAGARGYLTKNTRSEELVKAIRAVSDGEDYLGETISRGIITNYLRKVRSGERLPNGINSGLSDREKAIVKLIAEGLTYKEIGDRLCISSRTVEAHRNNIMQKLELSTIADLIKYSIREGITSL
jgi:DNA-binding NarL/FixJ family response regulator